MASFVTKDYSAGKTLAGLISKSQKAEKKTQNVFSNFLLMQSTFYNRVKFYC